MTATIARLILAMLILPVSGAVFVLGFLAIVPRNGPPTTVSLLAVWSVVYAVVATYWTLLWRRWVRWTRVRIVRTLLASGAALVFGCGFAVLVLLVARGA